MTDYSAVEQAQVQTAHGKYLLTAVRTIATSSVANPTVITTTTPHDLSTGASVTIAGHTGSTPAVTGAQTVTVTGPTTFTVPINVSVGGTGGTVTWVDTTHPLKATVDARIAAANAAKTTLTNAQLSTTAPYTANLEITVPPNRSGVDLQPEDAQGVEDLEQEVLIDDIADADTMFSKGGPMGNYTGAGSLSNYVDGAFLAERSKQTGEKLF